MQMYLAIQKAEPQRIDGERPGQPLLRSGAGRQPVQREQRSLNWLLNSFHRTM